MARKNGGPQKIELLGCGCHGVGMKGMRNELGVVLCGNSVRRLIEEENGRLERLGKELGRTRDDRNGEE